MSEMIERVAHEVALEICEATDEQAKEWAWPDDFVGDVIDRARSRATRVVIAVREPTDAMTRQFVGAQHGAYGDVEAAGFWRAMIDAALK